MSVGIQGAQSGLSRHGQLLVWLAVTLALYLQAACASSNIVRAPVTSPPTCADARFLYTDWTERGRGAIAVYRCGPEPERSTPPDR